MSTIVQKSRKEWAARAMRNAITRAERHMSQGDMKAAIVAMRKGAKTAESWMEDTHPQSGTHVKARPTTKILRRKPFLVGGVEMTGYQIRSAVTALENLAGPHVRFALVPIESPLLKTDYVALAKAHSSYAPGSKGVKNALIALLWETYHARKAA